MPEQPVELVEPGPVVEAEPASGAIQERTADQPAPVHQPEAADREPTTDDPDRTAEPSGPAPADLSQPPEPDREPAGDDPGRAPEQPVAHREPVNDDPNRAPELPEEAELSMLDPEVRSDLRALPRNLAEVVGRHLAAAGLLVDEDPELALRHARYARSRAARVAVVREAVGLTAYHAGEWAEALSELRAARRMSNGPGHIAVMADVERALGRPERALELAREGQSLDLPPDEAIELKIVAAGARRDMGQLDAAVVALQIPELDPNRGEPWTARLCYAYADNLAAAGRTEEAIRWFLNAAQADDEGETDAAERAMELSRPEGVQPVLDELH